MYVGTHVIRVLTYMYVYLTQTPRTLEFQYVGYFNLL